MTSPPLDRALDSYLVLACRAGSRVAFEALYRRWAKRLRAHAARLLGRSLQHSLDDACQEAWIDIARGLQQLHEPHSFQGWAYSIVTRRVADLRRQQGRRDDVIAGLPPHDGAAQTDGEGGESPQPQLRDALAALPRDDRALLHLFYIDELSVAETAQALGIPIGTVKSRLFQARQRLRRELQRRSS